MESMRKIFNTNRKHIKKRLLAMVLCCIMIMSGVSINISDNVAEAATLNIPNTQFITKDEILKLCTETNGGNGLLATGTDTDVELRVNFGNRPEDVKYFKDVDDYLGWKNKIDNPTEVKSGDIIWYITGKEDDNNVVLYVEEPIVSAGVFGGKIKFLKSSTIEGGKAYNSEYNTLIDIGVYSQGVNKPSEVYANHWGACSLRRAAKDIYNGTGDYSVKKYFVNQEKVLMKTSIIVNKDMLMNKNYKTEDVLYIPVEDKNNQGVLIGQNDNIMINMNHYAGYHWGREISDYDDSKHPQLGNFVLSFVAPNVTNITGTNDENTAFSPAFALDVSHLRFASVGDGTATAKLEKITDDMAMNLRLGEGSSGYPFTAQHKIKAKASEITYSAPKDSYLMFLAKDADGQLYQYAKKIDANVTNATMSLTNIPGLDKGEDFSTKVWIEKRAGGTLSYATEPIDVYNVKSWGAVKDERVDHVIQYVDKEGKTSVEIKPDNLKDDTIWLKEESEGKASWCGIEIPEGEIDLHKGLRFCIKMLSPTEKEYEDIYNQLDEEQKRKIKENNGIIFKISVEDTDGNKVQLDKPIKLFIQMEEKWDPESLEAYSITQGKSERISIDTSDLEDPERKDSFAIMPLNYFAPVVVYPNKLIEEPVPESTKPPVNDNKIDNTTGNKEDNSNNNSKENNTVNKILSPNTGESSTLGRIIAYLKLMMSSLGIMIIITKTRKKSQDL